MSDQIKALIAEMETWLDEENFPTDVGSLISHIHAQEKDNARFREALLNIKTLKGMEHLMYLGARLTIIEQLQEMASAALEGDK